MSDKLKTDSIDFIATKQDFIELMDENVRLQNELQHFVERACAAIDEIDEGLQPLVGNYHQGITKTKAKQALREEFK